jgi:VIT1/CCC1 family predicted Fe2+/Mn2+ transporter/rubrerythrin
MAEQNPQTRYTANIQGEVDSAALYRALADAEQNPQLAGIYKKLADVEDEHAAFWARELEKIGHAPPSLRPSLRSRILIWMARRFGPGMVLPTINAQERMDSGAYDNQSEAVAGGLPQAERSHARIINALAGEKTGALEGGTLARLEGRHRGLGGNALRAAVLGANDGLVSNMSLVMGVAGAVANSHVVLLTGLAGLAAGACSMAMGEWLSVATARESFERQIATEAEELAQAPEEEMEELALIYQAKGLPEETARTMANQLIANKDSALDTLAREELGIDPAEMGGSPWTAAATSFGLFVSGAIFPILPFIFGMSGTNAVLASLGVSGLALMTIGGATALFTGGSMVRLALRSLAFGYGAAAITFAIGKLVGVTVGG